MQPNLKVVGHEDSYCVIVTSGESFQLSTRRHARVGDAPPHVVPRLCTQVGKVLSCERERELFPDQGGFLIHLDIAAHLFTHTRTRPPKKNV